LKTNLRAGACRPVFLFAIAAAMLTASCYSSDYNRTVTANVALLSDMSDKLIDYCHRDFRLEGRAISSEEMGEFYYAFNKASAFSSSTPRETSRESHRT